MGRMIKETVAFAIAAGLLTSPAWSAISIAKYSAARHDRFYTGSDKAFLGENLDFSGVARAINTDGDTRWVTMISPTFFLSANHWHPDTGATVRFYNSNDPNGACEEHTVVGGASMGGGGDIWIGQLASSVSSNIAKYAILDNVLGDDATKANMIGQKMFMFGISKTSSSVYTAQAVGRNLISSISGTTSFYHPNQGATGFKTLGQDEAVAVGGDSGSPGFLTINNQPTIVGSRWTTTGTANAGSLASAIQNYVFTHSGGTESATFYDLPTKTLTPILRETFQNDTVNSGPKGSDQTIQIKKSGLITVAGSGGTYSDPFGGSDNKSLRMQATSSQTSSNLFMEGLQTGVVQGQWLMDFQAQAPSSSSDNGLFTLSLGHDYYGDQALDAPSGPYAESNLKMTLQANGRLNIQSNDGTFVSDQALEFDQKHQVQVLWRTNGTTDAYGDILVDGQRITSNNGAMTRFLLKTLGDGDLDRVDSVYLATNWLDGFDDPVVYFDNLFLLDIPEPASIGLLTLLGSWLLLHAQRRP